MRTGPLADGPGLTKTVASSLSSCRDHVGAGIYRLVFDTDAYFSRLMSTLSILQVTVVSKLATRTSIQSAFDQSV